MADLSTDIVVIGAGVLGLAVAAELSARGHDVRVIDPGSPNASSVAAGMIAPAFESLLDRADADRADLLREAAALWPDFASKHGLTLDETPAEWRGPDPEAVAKALGAMGFPCQRRHDAVVAASDVRIEPSAAMTRLYMGLSGGSVLAKATSLERDGKSWMVATPVGAIAADQVVLATGVGAPVAGLPRSVLRAASAVYPVAGQIGLVRTALTDRVLRGASGYVVPTDHGSLIGASMVEGQSLPVIDPMTSTHLISQAEDLTGRCVSEPIEWRAAVRGATPDGLPLAGPAGERLHLALAPRRNGWLMAPLVARIVSQGIEERPRGAYAPALDPFRFNPPAG